MQKKINVLITGGAGYVGSHLSMFLLKKNFFNVFSIDDFSNSKKNITLKLKTKFKKNYFFEKIDIRDQKKISHFFLKKNIDIVVHLAAKIEASESFEKKKEYKFINLDSTKNLIKNSITYKVKQFIFASSAAVYGNVSSGYCSEKKVCHPINPYGEYKLQAERYMFKNKKKMNFGIFRFFNIGGVNKFFYPFFHNRSSIFFLLASLLRNPKKLFLINKSNGFTKDNTPERDFIHIDDISKIIYHSLLSKKFFFVINCGSGIRTSVSKLIQKLEKVSGIKIRTKFRGARIGDPISVISNPDYLKKNIKKIKFFSINKILKDCYQMSLSRNSKSK